MTNVQMSGMDEIATLFNSKRRGILVNTFEEERFIEDLKLLIETKSMKGIEWSSTSQGIDIFQQEVEIKTSDPVKLMKEIKKEESSTAYIIKDYHDLWNNPQAKRALRDILEKPSRIYKPVILVSPQTNIPLELEKLLTVVSYDLPNRNHVIEQLEGIEAYLKKNSLDVPEGREREAIIHALTGMTHSEIINVLKKSVAKNKKIILEEITAEKEQVIKKTGLLSYERKIEDIKNVGGMDIFKDWLEDAKYAFGPEAEKYNVDSVRGAIAAGFPGTGKSLLSKAVANMWNIPLLKMNMSDIMDSRVGQSEKNIDRALKLAEAVSPCVLWVDEIEKGLSGIASSDRSDSGTLSRVVQSLLTWLSEKEAPVFVMATANDITKLPDELTRAGRFDEIFFVSLPSQSEREEILKIHLRKRGYSLSSEESNEEKNDSSYIIDLEVIKQVAAQMDNFTGAEIEQVVAEAGRRAFADFKKGNRETHYITQKDLEKQANQIIPLSQRNPGLLTALRDWAKKSAKCASSEEHQLLHGDINTKATLHDIKFDMDIDI